MTVLTGSPLFTVEALTFNISVQINRSNATGKDKDRLCLGMWMLAEIMRSRGRFWCPLSSPQQAGCHA